MCRLASYMGEYILNFTLCVFDDSKIKQNRKITGRSVIIILYTATIMIIIVITHAFDMNDLKVL